MTNGASVFPSYNVKSQKVLVRGLLFKHTAFRNTGSTGWPIIVVTYLIDGTVQRGEDCCLHDQRKDNAVLAPGEKAHQYCYGSGSIYDLIIGIWETAKIGSSTSGMTTPPPLSGRTTSRVTFIAASL